MNLSQYTTAQGWILNRYGHIYLQKFFFWLTQDAIVGTRTYWCFLFFATCVLVYWCARILAGKRGYVIGVIAVLLLYIQPLFAKELGCTLADFTVMFLVTLATFIYLAIFTERPRHRHLIIMLLGLIFFWALKSKETGICMAVLFLGLGRDEKGICGFRRFVKDLGWVCLGMLTGCAIVMFLDQIFLGDCLFSVRLTNIKKVLTTNLHRPPAVPRNRIVMSYYTGLSMKPLLAPLFAPFLLYLLVGWKAPRRFFSTSKKITWLLPLVLLLFLNFIRQTFHVLPRYFAPAIPGICIWSAQFFRFRLSHFKDKNAVSRIWAAAFLVLAAFVIICVFMVSVMPLLTEYYRKEPNIFYTVAIVPFSITILLMTTALSRKRGLTALFISSLCLFLLIAFPMQSNLSSLRHKIIAKKSQMRFEPYRVFAGELRFEADEKILVSKDVHKRSWMLGRFKEAHCWMFNIFFNQKYDTEQFIDGEHEDILKGDYTYAFLTWRDWKSIGNKHDISHLLKNYVTKTDKKTQLMLLKRRKRG